MNKNYSDVKGKYEINAILGRLRKAKKELEAVNNEIYRLQDEGSLFSLVKKGSRSFKGLLVNVLGCIPGGIGQKIKESYARKTDPLNAIEEEYRAHLDCIEGTIIDLREVIQQSDDKIVGLEGTLEQVEKEQWDINQIRQFIQEDSGVNVNEEVRTFFEYLTNEKLTEEEKTKQRTDLVTMLSNKLAVLKAEQPYLGEIAKAGRAIYDNALVQYNGFIGIKSQLEIMRDSALGYANTEDLTLFSKEFVAKFIEKTTETFETAIDAMSIAQRNLIASQETVDAINAARERLKARLEASMSGQPVKTKIEAPKVRPKITT